MTAPYPTLDGTQPCLNEDPETFFPPTRSGMSSARNPHTPEEQYAIHICAGCHLQPACLRYAIDHDVAGIWGGTTQKERRALRRQLSIKPAVVSATGWAHA